MSATRTRPPKPAPKPDTLADALRELGDIPPSRILWTPYPGTATEADALACLDGRPRRLVELIDGTLVEKAMGQRESYIAGLLVFLLTGFVRQRNLGLVGVPDLLLRVLPNQLRLPDVAFTTWERLNAQQDRHSPVGDYTPDLVVEILSESNTVAEITRKVREYFRGGARLVWVFEPDDRTVTVHTSARRSRVLTVTETLDGGAVLPGFTLNLSDFFNDPQVTLNQPT